MASADTRQTRTCRAVFLALTRHFDAASRVAAATAALAAHTATVVMLPAHTYGKHNNGTWHWGERERRQNTGARQRYAPIHSVPQPRLGIFEARRQTQ